MKAMKIRLWLVFILIGLVSGLQPAWADGPYRGKVIDAETKEPIEGAVVVAVWMKNVFRIIDSAEVFAEAKETVTDENGEFEIPGYKWTSFFFYFGVQPPRIYIFKPGYGFFPRYQVSPNPKQSNAALLEPFKTHGVVELPHIKKDREKRLEVLSEITMLPEGVHPDLRNYRKTIDAERVNLGLEPRNWKKIREEYESLCRTENPYYCTKNWLRKIKVFPY